jgi:LmbE family N-acetylglucosaminyl deacetylase
MNRAASFAQCAARLTGCASRVQAFLLTKQLPRRANFALLPGMKILCVHAHFDDYEFVAAGTFEMWKRKLGGNLRARLLVCTDGRAGHHFRTREETGRIRCQEQEASALAGGYEFELLRLPNGEPPREACLQVTPALLAGLWKSIREFEPDYLFCPPVPSDPLAGIHVDHVAVAEAVRKVAYMINVPHAFTPEYPADETQSKPCKVPVILNCYDSYMAGSNAHDLAVDVEEAFDAICEMTYCHQSQIVEWIPWVGRHGLQPPKSMEEWRLDLRRRFVQHNTELGIPSSRICEAFTVTAWGVVPTFEQLLNDFPAMIPEGSNLERLKKRLAHWNGDSLFQVHAQTGLDER